MHFIYYKIDSSDQTPSSVFVFVLPYHDPLKLLSSVRPGHKHFHRLLYGYETGEHSNTPQLERFIDKAQNSTAMHQLFFP